MRTYGEVPVVDHNKDTSMGVGCGGRMVDSVLGGHELKEPRSWGVKRLIYMYIKLPSPC